MMPYQFNLEINICKIFVKSYGFLSSAKHIGKNVSKNISKKLSSKYSQQIFVHAEQSGTDTFKTASKSKIQKTAESTVDWIENNKIADKIIKLQISHHRIIQKQLQVNMIKKYLKKISSRTTENY